MSSVSATSRVVVVSGGKFHAYHLARGVARAGRLHRFVTTVFDRRETGIPADRVVEIRSPAYLARALQRSPSATTQAISYYVGDNWFDRAASRYAGEADVYHVFSHHGLHGIRAAASRGAVTVIDRASAHPCVQHALLREEFERFGLSYPTLTRRTAAKEMREFEEADWIMVCSEFVRRTLVAHGVSPAKLRLTWLGFDPERFRPGVGPEGVFRVVFAGALSLQKGLPYLLEGFRRAGLPPDRSELVLVGEPWPESRAFLPRYAGLYRHIPFLPPEALARVYQSASVLALPSIQDGFGMVVFEAGACGLPVVVSENVGAPVRDGKDGFVVPIRDADAIAEKLVFFFWHEEVRRRMGLTAREHVGQFTWERYHREIAGHHREMLEARRESGPDGPSSAR
jgi:glycosyltransferase involved in cell wall biosynthesis